MKKILVSACLLGEKVNYLGGHNQTRSKIMDQWFKEGRIVSCCPEVLGGMSIPRNAAEIQKDGRVIDNHGQDVTELFQNGAQQALSIIREHHIQIAIMKAGSPSCGSSKIYDGTFSKQMIDGEGTTVKALRAHGVKVFNEHQLTEAQEYILSLEKLHSL